MEMNLKKLAPWNWFRKEQEEDRAAQSMPVQSRDLPVSSGVEHPMLTLQRQIDRLFDEAFAGFGFPTLSSSGRAQGWPSLLRPALDIQETAEQYRITLEVPGVDEKDIQITLNRDLLTIHGEKRREESHEEGGFHRVERSYGTFSRTLNLPEDADPEQIKASFRNGVLTINIAKREPKGSEKARTIPIE